jgi:c-di-AMP phosphodiesterase-like protein
MLERIEELKLQLVYLLTGEFILSLFVLFFFDQWLLLILSVIGVLNFVLIVTLMIVLTRGIKERMLHLTRVVGSNIKYALDIGRVGFLSFDEQYTVDYTSEFFDEFDFDWIGQRVTSIHPQLGQILSGEVKSLVIDLEDATYEIKRVNNTLFFKDISDLQVIQKELHDNAVVIGYIHFDNYEESTQYQEEHTIASIDASIRQPVIEWAKKKGMFLRRVKADRFLVVLNEKIFKTILEERFEILNHIREGSTKLDLAISLSMAFAKGTSDFNELEELANQALELAQNRGGDQVAIKQVGKQTQYYGGTLVSNEKRNKVKVRVMAQSLKELIVKSSNVIIVGHKEMDFDCIGSALAMSRICSAHHKASNIVTSGGIEKMMKTAFDQHQEHLQGRHTFVSESQALSSLNENTLVIMMDHHLAEHSNGENIIKKAKHICVIDHHRRGKDFTFDPTLVYIESWSSSVVELISELMQYMGIRNFLSPIEATIMLTGMMVDTNRFRLKTSSRTYEAAAYLRSIGAEPSDADAFLKESFDEFELKTKVLHQARYLDYGVVLVPYDEDILQRPTMSMVADQLLGISDIEASFVVARVSEHQVAVSARSRGKFNVQFILEKLGGGGHFTAAAVQKEHMSVHDLAQLCIEEINKYIETGGNA